MSNKSKKERSPEDEALFDLLVEKYHDLYESRARKKLGPLDAFSTPEQRLEKVEKITQRLLERDFNNGKLQKKFMTEQAAGHGVNVAALESVDPDTLDPEELMHEIDQARARTEAENEQKSYRINLPSVPHLMAASDDIFVTYVLDSVERYNIESAYYSLPADARKDKKNAADTYVTPIAKQFNVHSQKNGKETEFSVIRDPESTQTILCIYSENQLGFIHSAEAAMKEFNESGKISRPTRERFIIENAKDELRNAPYEKTERYLGVCETAIADIKKQLRGVETITDNDRLSQGAWLDTRPPLQPSSVTVRSKIDLTPKPPKA